MIHDLKPYPAYQGSGLPWLGDIPQGWTTKRAKYFFREVDERSQSGQEELLSVSHKTGVTPRSQKNITMFMAESYVGHKLCRAGDLVINTMWAWMAALGVSGQTGIVSPAYGVYRLKASDAFAPKYLDHLLRTQGYAAEYRCRSTGVNDSRLRLYPESFLEIPILCPPKEEQAAIVRFLDHADRRIRRAVRAKRKLIALLNEQKQVIIHQAVTRGLDPNARLKPSGVEWLGDIPDHWGLKKLKYEMAFAGGGTPSKSNESYWNGSIPWVSPKDMKTDIVSDAYDHITEQAVSESSTRLVKAGSILMVVRSGILQRTIPIALCDSEVALNQDMKALTPKGSISANYFIQFVKGCENLLLTEWTKKGATVESIEHQFLANSIVPIPPPTVQEEIVDYVRNATAGLDRTIGVARGEISLLLELRTRLISDVVTGKLDVRAAAAQLSAEELASESADDAEAILEDEEIPEDAETEEVEA